MYCIPQKYNYPFGNAFTTAPPRRGSLFRAIIPSLLSCEGRDCSEGDDLTTAPYHHARTTFHHKQGQRRYGFESICRYSESSATNYHPIVVFRLTFLYRIPTQPLSIIEKIDFSEHLLYFFSLIKTTPFVKN